MTAYEFDHQPAMKRHIADLTFEPSPFNMRFTLAEHRIVARHPLRKKVCIVGAGLGRSEAPLDDPTWEVWALNLVTPIDRHGCLRADIWWDIHQRVAQTADDLRWIAKCPCPIYVPPDLHDASQNAVRYPLDEIVAEFGAYFSCTFALQLALVLYERTATDVGLYGVELCWGTERERTVEWACTAYWLGRTEERGLNIHLPRQSCLGQHPGVYGFEYRQEIDGVNRYLDILKRGDDMRRQAKEGVDVGG